jgi:hypothetical protein
MIGRNDKHSRRDGLMVSIIEGQPAREGVSECAPLVNCGCRSFMIPSLTECTILCRHDESHQNLLFRFRARLPLARLVGSKSGLVADAVRP